MHVFAALVVSITRKIQNKTQRKLQAIMDLVLEEADWLWIAHKMLTLGTRAHLAYQGLCPLPRPSSFSLPLRMLTDRLPEFGDYMNI